MSRDRGSVTVWVLGVCIAVLFLGGLSVDVWRAFTERRVLAGMADGAVIAGATALDVDAWRSSGAVRLVPEEAAGRAGSYLTAHPEWDPTITDSIVPAPDSITVVLEREVEFTLLRILLAGEEPFRVSVTATAVPALSP